MPKSSRRKDSLMGKPKWTATDKKCEEYNGDMVKLKANVYVCTHCGLEQRHITKRRFFHKASWRTNQDQTNPKTIQSSQPSSTPYDQSKIVPFSYIHCPFCNRKFKTEISLQQHDRAKHHKPKVVDKGNIVFCEKCDNIMSVSAKRKGSDHEKKLLNLNIYEGLTKIYPARIQLNLFNTEKIKCLLLHLKFIDLNQLNGFFRNFDKNLLLKLKSNYNIR